MWDPARGMCDETLVESEIELTAAEGIPSTKINRRSFLTASLRSVADRTLDDDLGKAKILLNDFAVSEVEGFEDIYFEGNESPGRSDTKSKLDHPRFDSARVVSPVFLPL